MPPLNPDTALLLAVSTPRGQAFTRYGTARAERLVDRWRYLDVELARPEPALTGEPKALRLESWQVLTSEAALRAAAPAWTAYEAKARALAQEKDALAGRSRSLRSRA